MIQKRRLFQDEAGREWAVFAVTPDAMFGGGVRLLPREYADGATGWTPSVWSSYGPTQSAASMVPFSSAW